MICTEYYQDDEMMEDEMGGACCTYEGEEKCVHGFTRMGKPERNGELGSQDQMG